MGCCRGSTTAAAGPKRYDGDRGSEGDLRADSRGRQGEGESSTYVSTDVRDAIMLMMPGLIRLFAASENPVFIVPRGDDEVDKAQQATDYTNYVFWNDNSGFLILYGALKDALTVRTGYVKWWCDENKETVRKRFTNVTADQIQQLIMENPSAKLVHVGNPVPSGMPRQPPMAPGSPGLAPTPPMPPPSTGPMPSGPPRPSQVDRPRRRRLGLLLLRLG